MPEKETLDRAREDAREGKSSSTQAGEFVREEMHHIREGKHGARSTKQAIAIGLSKARRAGVKLQRPRKGTASAQTRSKASADLRRGGPAANHRRNVPLRRPGHSSVKVAPPLPGDRCRVKRGKQHAHAALPLAGSLP